MNFIAAICVTFLVIIAPISFMSGAYTAGAFGGIGLIIWFYILFDGTIK